MTEVLDKPISTQMMPKQASKQASGTTVHIRLPGRLHSNTRGEAHLI